MAIIRHRIAFAPDGTMFLSSGERQKFDPAQDTNSDLGKILHLTDEGPARSAGTHSARMGHRNLLGLAFAPDGRLWEIEMGPKGGDEVNLILPGKNYGWPEASYGSHYDGRDIPDHHPGRRLRGAEGLVEPVDLAWRAADLHRRPVPAVEGRCADRRAVGRGVDPRRHQRRQGAQGRPMGRWARASARSTRARAARSICSRTATAAGGCCGSSRRA